MAARPRSSKKNPLPPNLYRNTRGYLWYRNPDTGKTYGLGYDERAAIDDARAANAELARKKSTLGLVARMSGDETISSWCDRYAELYAERSNSTKSKRSMGSILNRVRKAPFAKTAISNVTPKEINDWLKDLETEVSPTYAIDLRYRLTGFFNEAIAEGLLSAGANPVTSLRKQTATVLRDRLTLDSFLAIIAAAKESPKDVWAARAFMLALLSAQRRADVRSMRFSDVKGGFLFVDQQKSQHRTRLKIPTSIGLRAVGCTLEQVIRECRDSILSPWMVHHISHQGVSGPGAQVHLDTMSAAFSRFRDQAKVQPAPGRTAPSFHEIRSLAARLYSDEYGPEFAQALLGHKSAAMTALYRDSRGKEWTEIKIGSQ
ncbi:tyrosine-type recombinase/integrase [Burkholderia sp. JKS000303]|uniref:tyrosine-type recombinase/integrase n=1 Tax=Burkholderia sp. JKS000303 TaxID=1938747 RepID=UPI0015CF7521|nr:tyrosine-type recombinase/integrase [Burkholderia sp. JKS000303]